MSVVFELQGAGMDTRDPVAGRIEGNRRGYSVSRGVRCDAAGGVVCESRRVVATARRIEYARDAALRIKVVRDGSPIRKAADRRVRGWRTLPKDIFGTCTLQS